MLRGLRCAVSRPFGAKAHRRTHSVSASIHASHSTSAPSENDFELFGYTSGRWLYNESRRLEERFLDFNVAELKGVAAKAVNKSEQDVRSIRKLAEGGFNRSLEVTMDDGLKIVARLPYPTTGPKRYAVASEVATIDLVRSYGVPVPAIYDYSVTSENAVGSAYIIMEKMRGIEVGHRWFELSTSERKSITLDVARIEALLFSIRLPASGSIYHKRDLISTDEFVSLPNHEDFCVGPMADLSWWYDRRDTLEVNRGPFKEAEQVMAAGAEKELAWMKQFGQPRYPFDRHLRDLFDYQKSSPSEHIKNLEDYLKISSHLVPKDVSLLRPVLRHPDLQPHNIFVSEDFNVVGLIDWQHCPVLPLFLQAGVPKYWQNTTDEPTVLEKPTLPAGYEQLSELEKSQAMAEFRQRQIYMLYLGGTSKFNRDHIDAYLIPGVPFKKRIFNSSSVPWEGNNVRLKADLMLAARNWSGLAEENDDGPAPPCPMILPSEEIASCLQLHTKISERMTEMEHVRTAIGIGSDGWVTNENFDGAAERNAEIKRKAIESLGDTEEQALCLAHYPFQDHEEGE